MSDVEEEIINKGKNLSSKPNVTNKDEDLEIRTSKLP